MWIPFNILGTGSSTDRDEAIDRAYDNSRWQLEQMIAAIESMGGEVIAVVVFVDELESVGAPPPDIWGDLDEDVPRVHFDYLAKWRFTGELVVIGLPPKFSWTWD